MQYNHKVEIEIDRSIDFSSSQVDALIMYADFMIQQLVSGLEARGLDSCVNMVVLADHGMAASGADKIIKLKDYVPDIYDLAYTYSGAFGRISLKNESEGEARGGEHNL